MTIFLPLETQNLIFLAMRLVLCFSLVLHTVAGLCLLKQTPPNQSAIRNYLFYIQVLLIMSDLHMGLLFEPIPLFPALAGYCIGIACQHGVPVQVETGITVLIIANIGAAIVLCITFRHQSIIPETHPLKMGKMPAYFVHFALIIVFSTPPILYAVSLQDPAESEQLLMEHHDLLWIRERGPWLVQGRSSEIVGFFVAIVIIVLIGFVLGIAMFLHMFYILNADHAKRSAISIRMIRTSLFMLLVQLVVPIGLLVIPAGVIYAGLAVEGLISFETSFAMFLLIPLHPIGHNAILLSVTSTYRRFIACFVRRCFRLGTKISVKDVGTTSSVFGKPHAANNNCIRRQSTMTSTQRL